MIRRYDTYSSATLILCSSNFASVSVDMLERFCNERFIKIYQTADHKYEIITTIETYSY